MIDAALFLLRHKRLLLSAPLAVAVVAAAISLALPNYYAGVTKILPPQQNQSSAALLLAQLGTSAGLPASAVGLKNPNELYVGMLKSRTVADRLITLSSTCSATSGAWAALGVWMHWTVKLTRGAPSSS